MTQAAGRTVLITGANAGIGKEAARQLALRDDTGRIYLACRKPSPALAYGQAKYIAALWMASMARQHPDLRFVTMSPGNTSGTGTLRDQPLLLRLAARYVMPALGLSHDVKAGAGRLVDGITDPALRSGVFYASAASTVTGPVTDQADIFPDLRNATFQDNASQAIHRFIQPGDRHAGAGPLRSAGGFSAGIEPAGWVSPAAVRAAASAARRSPRRLWCRP
jgi:hypothetical protein